MAVARPLARGFLGALLLVTITSAQVPSDQYFSKLVQEVQRIGEVLNKTSSNPDVFFTSKDLWPISERIEEKAKTFYDDVYELGATFAAIRKKYMPATECPGAFKLTAKGNCFWAAPKTGKLTHKEARADCWSVGADLAHPEDIDDLKNFIDEEFPNEGMYTASFHIGAASDPTKAFYDFRWFDGRLVKSIKRSWSEPFKSGDCFIIRKGRDPQSNYCLKKRQYICQLPLKKE